MDISPKERFLDICNFKRPDDLCLTTTGNAFWGETLREWIKQGAPEQILNAHFRGDYFQFQHVRWLAEIRSGIVGGDVSKKTDLGYGIIVDDGNTPIVPAYEPRIVEEDERTVIFINGTGQKVKSSKQDPQRMPMFLDWPVKDRATWNEYKKRLDPNTPGRCRSTYY